jgi:predicted GTPase
LTARLDDLKNTSDRMDAWLKDEGRWFFERWDPDRLPTLKRMVREAKESLYPYRRDLPICCLGNAGVGKSTLINSLVDPVAQVVPQGGVGPLTAQATVVRYSDRPYLDAKYFGAQRLNQLTFALDRLSERRQRRALAEENVGLDIATQNELMFVLSTRDDATDEDRQHADSRARSYVSQARLLVTGNQYGEDTDDEITYFADMLRVAVGRKPAWGHSMRSADKDHIAAVHAAISLGEDGKHIVAEGDRSQFLAEVRHHATGSIAPLIKSLEVGWHSENLKNGLMLVDLPGVGVANDEYRSVTSDWIRRASAVVLVVDRAGVTEASADMLRVTGFLNSLLHRAPDSTDISPLLWVVAVKLDDVARDERTSFKQQHPNEKLPRWLEFFQESCKKAQALIRNQLVQELEKTTASAPEEVRDGRSAAQAKVLAQLQVHAVSAIEYRKFLAQDDDDRALVTAVEESNVPHLAQSMRDLAAQHLEEITATATKAVTKLLSSVHRGINGVLEDVEGTHYTKRMEETRARLNAFIAPHEKDLHRRQGQLHARLRETIPATIEKEVTRGVSMANRSVSEWLVVLQRTHWSTLRATVRRGGVRVGRRTVDLPNELALRFEEPIAVIWNRSVVEAMKAALQTFVAEFQRTVDAVVKWAGSSDVNIEPKRIERYRADVSESLNRLLELGNAGAISLRDQVKQHLHETMETTIRTECQRFVESGMDKGTGVGQRVVAFLKDAIATATRAAASEACQFLVQTYQGVITNVSAEFSRASEALGGAQSALIGERPGSEARRKDEADHIREMLTRVPVLPEGSA